MGRAEKLKVVRREERATGVQLEELDYLRLVQARGKIDAAMLNGQKACQQAAADAQAVVDAAKSEFVKAYTATAKKYKFNPKVSHTMDDKRFLLIPEDGQ